MAPYNGNSHKSRTHTVNVLQKPLLRLSKTSRPSYHTQTTANAANSHSSTKQTSPVIGSRISKHCRTAAGNHERRTSTSSKPVGNTYKNKRTSNPTTQAIITVHINNRLGGSTAIQCSPQDKIRTLKVIASLKLGIRPEAMMLKRQGQRALRDGLTLEDYEIGDRSSLDLEVDTEN